MEIKKQNGTAVLGDSNLENGQRTKILEIFYSYYQKIKHFDVGVIMVG